MVKLEISYKKWGGGLERIARGKEEVEHFYLPFLYPTGVILNLFLNNLLKCSIVG